MTADHPGDFQRHVARLSVAIFLALLAGFTGMAYRASGDQPISVAIRSMADPEHLGVVTRITLTVSNRSGAAVTPVFTVPSHYTVPTRWRSVIGPRQMLPGETAVYVLEAPPDQAVAVGDDVVVRVDDAASMVLVTSPPLRATLPDSPPLVNPRLTVWSYDATTGRQEPLGWNVVGLGFPAGRDARVERATVEARRGLILRLGRFREPRWREIFVQQYVADSDILAPLFERGFTIAVYPTFRYTRGYGPHSGSMRGSAFGVQVYADGGWLWIMFSDRAAGWQTESDAAVVVMESPLNRWSLHYINLHDIYVKLRWPTPRQAVIALFAATDTSVEGSEPAFGPIFLGDTGSGR